MDRFNNLIKNLKGQHKMGKFLLFLFMFFFIFKIIDYILTFFDISKELGYSYFIWFSILFFLFVLLPLDPSYLNFKSKEIVAPQLGISLPVASGLDATLPDNRQSEGAVVNINSPNYHLSNLV